jgi:uncharacterized protein
MAIQCVKCGRQYDVTLFQFGRTIGCACGERVGEEHRLNIEPNNELKFFADVMLGRLMRWLRALGIDTAWEDAIPDGELVRRALAENRYILTRDRRLPQDWRVSNYLMLKSEDSLEQLREVVEHFNIKPPTELFTRCLMCNTLLRPANAEEIAAQVPPAILEQQSLFHFCPNCQKVYWSGSHTNRMRQAIETVFNVSLR